MARIVQKFGGTSVADIAHIRNAATRVQAELDKGSEVAVVVSAIEPRPDGHGVVRLWNASDQPRRVALGWRLPGPPEAVDLAEQPADGVEVQGNGPDWSVALGPHQIVTRRSG